MQQVKKCENLKGGKSQKNLADFNKKTQIKNGGIG